MWSELPPPNPEVPHGSQAGATSFCDVRTRLSFCLLGAYFTSPAALTVARTKLYCQGQGWHLWASRAVRVFSAYTRLEFYTLRGGKMRLLLSEAGAPRASCPSRSSWQNLFRGGSRHDAKGWSPRTAERRSRCGPQPHGMQGGQLPITPRATCRSTCARFQDIRL